MNTDADRIRAPNRRAAIWVASTGSFRGTVPWVSADAKGPSVGSSGVGGLIVPCIIDTQRVETCDDIINDLRTEHGASGLSAEAAERARRPGAPSSVSQGKAVARGIVGL